MNASKYLNAISKGKAAAGEGGFILPGNCLLVERIPQEEVKTKGGIIIADASKTMQHSVIGDAPVVVRVVAVGEGYEEDGVSIPLDTPVGSILVVGDHSVKWFSLFPLDEYETNTLGLCSEEQTQIRFRDDTAYAAFKAGSAS